MPPLIIVVQLPLLLYAADFLRCPRVFFFFTSVAKKALCFLPDVDNCFSRNSCGTVPPLFRLIQNKMELAMGVAVGSATQVSMFVVPVAVLSGWAMVSESSGAELETF